MSSKLLSSFSQDIANLLVNTEECDVIIHVGKEDPSLSTEFDKEFVSEGVRTFRAHSLILRARSNYFQTALSKQWARKEGDFNVLSQPNVAPEIFEIILGYIYSGAIVLSDRSINEILEILVAADELLLTDLLDFIQEYLVEIKNDWLHTYILQIYQVCLTRDSCSNLQEFILVAISSDPDLLFKSEHFLKIDESLLLPVLIRDDLDMAEDEVWDNLIKWGCAQNNLLHQSITPIISASIISSFSNLDDMDMDGTDNSEIRNHLHSTRSSISSVCSNDVNYDLSSWTSEDFSNLKSTLHECIPLIRFFQMSSSDLYDRVWPFRSILPPELEDDIVRCHLKLGSKPTFGTNTPRGNSTLMGHQHMSRIADWIDRNESPKYCGADVPYKFRLLLRGTRDGFDSKTFHRKCDDQGPTFVIMKIANSGEIIGGYNPIKWKIGNERLDTRESFLFSFGSKNRLEDAKLSRVTRSNYAILLKDENYGPCFGDKDLWMYGDFSVTDSCSSKEDDYETWITKHRKFAISEYEVFKIIRK
ncbi:8402_t:CDS:2 [Acaulospora morrowiae]|uniref:8402_t:CDS:1 n=1 Tax=Acaulospora morrowiae TaxID=94023 RepID=A0A9N8ZTB1_9GLOM|nr:8402_t:CDS:2 [Acaulospora morrowiae]